MEEGGGERRDREERTHRLRLAMGQFMGVA